MEEASDTLRFARALRDAGVPGTQAEATAEAINDAFTVQIATKDDITAVRSEIAALRTELRAEMSAMKMELRADIANVRTEMLRWMIAQTFTLLAAIAALLHFLK